MKKLAILSVITLGFISVLQAQTFEDAVRFSRLTNTGTARSTAMGGAFGALGGDLSTLSYNPAGIGVFRKSEMGITLNFNTAITQASGYSPKDHSFQMGDLGAVFAFYSPKSDWKGFNFGINYTSLNNFNRTSKQFVDNSTTSFTNALAAESFGLYSDELNSFTSSLAYGCWLLDSYELEDKTPYYESILGSGQEVVSQYKKIKEDGYQGEYALSFGTNYKDKFYLGATIGIQNIQYTMNSTYQEAPGIESPSGLDYYDYFEYKRMNGVGTNLKFGIIYRPFPQLRIGAAIHTPTWYNMNYKISSEIQTHFWTKTDEYNGRDGFDFGQSSGIYTVDFNMKTPWRAIFSLASVLKQKAIISIDYEYVNYASARFGEISDDNNDKYADSQNDDIRYFLRSTHNLRLGAEYRFNSTFSLRAGYSFWDSPYYEEENKKNNRLQAISTGFGLNFGMFYCDAAYSYKKSKNQTRFYSYYDLNPDNDILAEQVSNKYISHEAKISLGIRF